MEIEKRKTSSLRPHERNAFIYGEPDRQCVEMIKRNGIKEALVVTGDGRIISGHTRWLAATEALNVHGFVNLELVQTIDWVTDPDAAFYDAGTGRSVGRWSQSHPADDADPRCFGYCGPRCWEFLPCG